MLLGDGGTVGDDVVAFGEEEEVVEVSSIGLGVVYAAGEEEMYVGVEHVLDVFFGAALDVSGHGSVDV